MFKSSEFPTQFQKEGLELIDDLLPLTSSAFCLVDPDMQSKGVILRGVEEETDRAYRAHYKNLDPAHPSRIKDKYISLQCMSRSMPLEELHNSIFYKNFLQPSNIEDAVDLYLRFDGEIIAVLSLLRDESLPKFSDSELKDLHSIQRFLNYVINLVYTPKRVSQRNYFSEKYGLTNRELDVMELIVAGANNKVIASELSIGTATVKTHLTHIFDKMNVDSRTKLLSKIVSEIEQ